MENNSKPKVIIAESAAEARKLLAEGLKKQGIDVIAEAADGQDASPAVDGSTSRAPVLSLEDEAAVDALYARVTADGVEKF